MAQTGRPRLSPTQKRELWQRWQAGEPLNDIGRSLCNRSGAIHGILATHGASTPPVRTRSREIADRAVPGHREGDLITSSSNSHLATPVERTLHFSELVKVDGKGIDLLILPQGALNRVADELNGRPRKTFGFVTPAEASHRSVALIV